MADTDKITLQRVRFKGARTGLPSIAVKGFGQVHDGQTIEVTADEAARYTAPRKGRDGKETSDFVKVGGEFAVEKDEVMQRRLSSRDKLNPDGELEDNLLPDEVNTEAAHETVPEKGTVEEYAEVIAAEPEAADESKGDSKKK